MSLLHFHRRRLISGVRLYEAGRKRVIWRNGVLYCGGSLFLLYNAVDYLIEPAAPATPIQITWFFVALLASICLGYLYGRFTWHSLDRLFHEQSLQTNEPSKPVQ